MTRTIPKTKAMRHCSSCLKTVQVNSMIKETETQTLTLAEKDYNKHAKNLHRFLELT